MTGDPSTRWNGTCLIQRNTVPLIQLMGTQRMWGGQNIITRHQWISLTREFELLLHVRAMIWVAILGDGASTRFWPRFVRLRNGSARSERSPVSGGKHTGDTKTEGSEEQLPTHENLYRVLAA
jgi:hypothetical protein